MTDTRKQIAETEKLTEALKLTLSFKGPGVLRIASGASKGSIEIQSGVINAAEIPATGEMGPSALEKLLKLTEGAFQYVEPELVICQPNKRFVVSIEDLLAKDLQFVAADAGSAASDSTATNSVVEVTESEPGLMEKLERDASLAQNAAIARLMDPNAEPILKIVMPALKHAAPAQESEDAFSALMFGDDSEVAKVVDRVNTSEVTRPPQDSEEIITSGESAVETGVEPTRPLTEDSEIPVIGEATPENAPQLVLESGPEVVSENAPEVVPQTAPAVVSETAPEVVSETAPEAVSETAPEAMLENAPEAMLENAPEVVSANAPEVVPENAREAMPENVSEVVLENTAEPVMENTPDPLLENAQESVVQRLTVDRIIDPQLQPRQGETVSNPPVAEVRKEIFVPKMPVMPNSASNWDPADSGIAPQPNPTVPTGAQSNTPQPSSTVPQEAPSNAPQPSTTVANTPPPSAVKLDAVTAESPQAISQKQRRWNDVVSPDPGAEYTDTTGSELSTQGRSLPVSPVMLAASVVLIGLILGAGLLPGFLTTMTPTQVTASEASGLTHESIDDVIAKQLPRVTNIDGQK